MKNKKGFTLIELMAVVAILAILALVITPIIDKNIKKSKTKMYNAQIENIRMVGKNYYTDNPSLIPLNGNYSFVKIESLVNLGYMNGNIKNPQTGREFEEEIYIQIFNDDGTYKYSVCPMEEDCEEYEENPGSSSGGFKKVKDINQGIICGEGLEEDYDNVDVCYIYSAEDLVEFSNLVNSGKTFQNKTVKLMNNIDIENPKSYVDATITGFGDVNKDGEEQTLMEELTDHTQKGYPRIGDNTKIFAGTFEGNGNKIKNLYIDESNGDYAGLFAINSGTIRGLIIERITVKGRNYVGGIVGYNYGKITSVKVNGNVSSTGTEVGLVAGRNHGYRNVGLIEAVANGNVTSTYTGSAYVGGIVGYNHGGTIGAVYQGGTITGNVANKIIGGYSDRGIILTAVSLDTAVVNNETPTATNLGDLGGYSVNLEGIGNISAYENVVDTYVGKDNNTDGYYYDYDDTGDITVYSMENTPLNITMSGAGTSESPYLITNYNELKQVAYDPTKVYKLTADINLNNQQQVILASNTNTFTGTFIGDEHTLSNIRLIGHDYLGLFGRNTGTIKSLKLDNIYANGYNETGALVGENTKLGVIKGIMLTGNIIGNTQVGGIVGYNYGTITSVKTNGNVSATGTEIGLIAGRNHGAFNIGLIEAVAKGNVTSTSTSDASAGGIVGYNHGGTISAAYQGGTITAINGKKILGGYNFEKGVTLNAVSLDTATVNGNTYTSTSLGDFNGKTYSETALGTSAPYEEIGLNFTVTDPTTKEYIWYFTTGANPILTFTEN